jgi:O-antigen biosynthesis protein
MNDISTADDLLWTGERLVPGCRGQILYEHLHRYAVALRLASRKAVVDIACGEGYGAHLLSRVASRIIGVDNDAATIRHAQQTYVKDNLVFREGSCLDIPVEDQSIDLVVSFETIEHLDDHTRFLLEIKRILTPQGLLVISSPDKRWYSDRTGQINPFHKVELYHEEFERLIKSHFRNCRIGKQQMVAGSWIASDGVRDRDSLGTFSGDLRSVRFENGVADGLYSIAFCSDAEIPPLCLGIFENRRDSENIWNLLDRYSSSEEIQARIATSEQVLAREDDLKRKLGDQEARLTQSQAEMARQDGRICELQQAYANLDRVLQREQIHRNKLHRQLERVRVELDQRSQRAQKQLDVYEEELKKGSQQYSHVVEELTRSSAEVARLRERFQQTNQLLLEYCSHLTEVESQNQSLSQHFRQHLSETKRLLRMLDQFRNAATLLRRSRRWILANPFAALAASLRHKPLKGFGHLDNNVEKYLAWRKVHPEMDRLDEEIQSLRSPRTYKSAPSLPENRPLTAFNSGPVASTPPLSFHTHKQPVVSIVIPVHNHFCHTQSCLGSIQQHHDNVPLEVIVVDDGSTDETNQVLGRLPGIAYIRNESSVGFIESCNCGAARARGEYLLFLNNDTVVTPGWLRNLLDTFQIEPRAGLVGSKLVYPDGRLQEAGGIIWRDGSGWNRGKFQDPSLPEYNFVREVDYCSAASVIIPRNLFEETGGFDDAYSPAYYEDTDLAFKVRRVGRKVLYQPLSVVIHHEGATAGTDISAGTKKYQEINRATFVSRWSEQLAAKPVNGDVAAWDSPAHGCARILIIDHHLPMADRDSGSLRMFQILSILHRLGHRVTFFPDNLADIPPYGDRLRMQGVEVVHYPYYKSVAQYLEAHGKALDVIVLSRCDFAAKHIAAVRQLASQAFVIFDTVDLHFLRQQREAELLQDEELKERANEKRQLEGDLIDQADQTWVVSPAEQALLRAAHPNRSIEVVSNIVETPGSTTPFSDRRDILFIGSFQHPPNVDAVRFFAHEIFPGIRQCIPGIKFYIIGDHSPPEILRLANERIVVTGYQPDVSIFFNTIRLSVAPLRYGAGVKGKVNQSMGYGVPVVATSVAVEGMSLTHNKDVLIADEPESFAAAVIELCQSEELWTRLSHNSLIKARELFSPDAARRQLARILNDDRSHATPTEQTALWTATQGPSVAEPAGSA